MATGDDIVSVADDLTEMSVEDFLQEAVPAPAPQDHAISPRRPPARHHRGRYTPRCGGRRGRGEGGFGGAAPPTLARRGGVRAGVMMAHDPPRGRPLSRRTPLSLPQESVLTVGSRHAPSVKEEAGSLDGGVALDMEAVLTNAQSQEVTFVLSQTLPVSPGQLCHFLPVADLGDVRRDTILKLLVGLLNAGGRGVVYLGVASDGRVEGITCDARTVAQFVEGLMKTVRFYLMPRLHAPCYGVRYTNVVTAGGQLLNNVWVVELHALPRTEHYYNAAMDMTYHIRHGTETKSLPFTSFCHVVVAGASRPFEEELTRLEEDVRHLKKALEERGVDTSSVGPHVCDNCWFNDCPVQCYGRPVATVDARRPGLSLGMGDIADDLPGEESQ